MKKIKQLGGLMLLFLATSFNHANAQGEVNLQGGPVITVDKETHDYGKVDYAGDGQCTFTITNTGTADLLITEARGSCGCTVPTYSKEPIAPGKSTTITVNYDTKREGDFAKTVTIMTNATNEPVKVVKIKGTVAPNPNPTPAPTPATTPGNTVPQ
jgi:hypothetical protein